MKSIYIFLFFIFLSGINNNFAQVVDFYQQIKVDDVEIANIKFPENARLKMLRYPQDGLIWMESQNGFNQLNYRSYGARSVDSILFMVTENGAKSLRGFEIIHRPILAREDFFVIQNDESSLSLDVTSNDYSRAGDKTITDITFVSKGDALIENNQILFTPNGYGLGWVFYTICNQYGECDNSVVRILNIDLQNTVKKDTISLVENINNTIELVAPEGFELKAQEIGGQIFKEKTNTYSLTPRIDEEGIHYIEFINPTSGKSITYQIYVYDHFKTNKVSNPDEVFVPRGKLVTAYVGKNDAGITMSDVVSQDPSVQVYKSGHNKVNILSSKSGSEMVTAKYTNCIDTYCDDSFIKIITTDFEPVLIQKFPVESTLPFVIKYNNPYDNWSLKLVTPTTYGEVEISPNGQEIIYTNSDVHGISDVASFEYCLQIGEVTRCYPFSITFEVLSSRKFSNCSSDDCLWPGDTNNDGKVDIADVFKLSKNIGEKGISNYGLTPYWMPHHQAPWKYDLTNSLQYVDTDGNGIIDIADLDAIDLHYGKEHFLQPQAIFADELQVHLQQQGEIIQAGDELTFEVSLGDAQNKVTNISDLSYGLEFLSSGITISDIQIESLAKSWFVEDYPIIDFQKSGKDGQSFVHGLSRVRGDLIEGFGKVAKVKVIIDDYVDGFRPEEENNETKRILNIKAHAMVKGIQEKKHFEKEYLFEMDANGLLVKSNSVKRFEVLPTITSDFVNILTNNSEFASTDIEIYNTQGQRVLHSNSSQHHTRIDLNEFANGVYSLKLIQPDHTETKKIIIQK